MVQNVLYGSFCCDLVCLCMYCCCLMRLCVLFGVYSVMSYGVLWFVCLCVFMLMCLCVVCVDYCEMSYVLFV